MIEVKNLTKNYGLIKAVNRINFKVAKGDVLAFLGPNGAGKSTTIKLISGFLNPTSGIVIINGVEFNTAPEKSKRIIGYMPESTPAYKEMTTFEYLKFTADAYELDNPRKAVERIIGMTNLNDVENQLIETLSKGYRSRLSFAAAIIHDPEILLLDEPTDGLDPNQKAELRTLISKLSENKAIIISTHILEEVGAMCNRVIIISEGEIVLNGTPQDLQNHTENNNKTIIALDPDTKQKAESAIGSPLLEFTPINFNSQKSYLVEKNIPIQRLIQDLSKVKIEYNEIYINHAPLDGAFSKLTKSKE